MSVKLPLNIPALREKKLLRKWQGRGRRGADGSGYRFTWPGKCALLFVNRMPWKLLEAMAGWYPDLRSKLSQHLKPRSMLRRKRMNHFRVR